MAPMIVRRVCLRADPSQGPWRADSKNYKFWELDADSTMPGREMDGLYADHELIAKFPKPDRVYGVHTRDGLQYFTRRDRELLKGSNFVVRRYMVPPGTFVRGMEQVVFYLPAAILVNTSRL